jgi:uncharacterized membrane protein
MDSQRLPSKEPATKMAGPYGHPFHPLFVTIPIGTWVASVILDIASKASNDPNPYVQSARWLIGIGIIGAIVAAIFGLMDQATIPSGTPAKRTAMTHMTLNTLVLVAFIVSWFIRGNGGIEADGSTSTELLILSIVALLVLTVSGWLGGMMAYRFGVRVARESDQAEGYGDERTTPTDRSNHRRAA